MLLSLFAVFCLTAAAQETGGIKGKVRGSRGEALAEATIIAQKDGKDLKTVTASTKGDFILDGLAEGKYNFVFDKSGYNPAILYDVEVRKNKIRDLGSDKLVLSVDPGLQVIVKGLVFDQEGHSIPGANIEIEKEQADGSYKRVGVTTTSYGFEQNARGEFTYRFPQGSAKLRVKASMKGITESKEIEVSTAAIYRLAITLKVEK